MNRLKTQHILQALYFLAFTAVFVNTAWLCDDIFITFRAVDNFLKGYGPVWNVGERVQVYTHPLWYALLIIGTGIFKHHYWFTLALSYACLLGTLYLFLKIARHGNMALAMLASIALLLSRAFADFSSSGLENPLLHLLLCAYVLVAITQQDASKRFLHTSLLYSLLFLTRPDAIVLVTPTSLWMLWQAGKTSGWGRTLKLAAIAAAPALAWEAFSLIYYGSLVPNTAIAKTNLGYPRSEMLARGWDCIKASIRFDPIILGAVLLAAPISIFLGRNHLPRLLMVGVALQLFYVCWVGGDYMAGRFLTTSLLVSCLAIALSGLNTSKIRMFTAATWQKKLSVCVCLAICLVCIITFHTKPKFVRSRYGVVVERNYYYGMNRMMHIIKNRKYKSLTRHPESQPVIKIYGRMGKQPWMLGEKTYFIDGVALTDPYLARIAALPHQRIGHYVRDLPEGYIETLISGTNVISASSLASLYDDVALAVRAPLFSKNRWKSIWRLNTGFYKKELLGAKTAVDFFNGVPGYTTIPVLPSFSPFSSKNASVPLDKKTQLQSALAYEDENAFKGLLVAMRDDRDFARNLSQAAYGLWFLPLIQAKRGEDKKFKALLDAGADFNTPEPYYGYSVLEIAHRLDYAEGVRLLLDKGINIDRTNDQGQTALMLAVASERQGSVDFLLKNGADANITDSTGETALMKAAQRGHIGIAKLLLTHGADMVEKGKDRWGRVHGRTALMHAAWHGRMNMVQFLLERGVNVNAVAPRSGETALINAARRGHTDTARLLLDKGANVNAVKTDAATALGLALSGVGNVPKRNRDMVELLLERGADPSAALPEAVRSGSLQSVQFLVHKGVNVNFADDAYGSTPLMHAAWHGRRDIVIFLLAEKAAVNAVNKSGLTALWLAAAKGHTDIAKTLIKNGADIDKASNAGQTPLMEAAANGHAGTVRLLLKSGADIRLANKRGETALQIALLKKHGDVVDMLRAAGARDR